MTDMRDPDVWPDPPDWPPGDLRWAARAQGWIDGYAAAQADRIDLNPEMVDELVLARFGEMLALLREVRGSARRA